MTLREKFNELSCNDCVVPYCDIKCTMLSENELDRLEKITDEFAIGFAEWICEKAEVPYIKETMNGTLEIYKKEKGL